CCVQVRTASLTYFASEHIPCRLMRLAFSLRKPYSIVAESRPRRKAEIFTQFIINPFDRHSSNGRNRRTGRRCRAPRRRSLHRTHSGRTPSAAVTAQSGSADELSSFHIRVRPVAPPLRAERSRRGENKHE